MRVVSEALQAAVLASAGVLGGLALTGVLLARARVRVRASQALILRGLGAGAEPRVTFTDTLVLPLHSHELVDLSRHELVITRRGPSALRCRDNLRANVVATVALRVNRAASDVLRAAERLRAEGTADPEAIAARFEGDFASALAAVAREVTYAQLATEREALAARVREAVGDDLDGYVVDALHLREVSQVPLAELDPDDVLDAEAIRAIRASTEPLKGRERGARAQAKRAHVEAAGGERGPTSHPPGGYRSDVAAAEARVVALEQELAEAKRTLAALCS